MLVAKRDPFHPGANDVSIPRPRLARAYSVLQICGTLLAVPVGLGSAYSVYRANFSVETACQNLRVNIVAMLDRGVDAKARHMLVRRDVEAFEKACGDVDPDATAAFKTLLAADMKPPAVAAPVVAVTPPKADAKPEAVARKAEPRADTTAKQPAKINPAAAAVVAAARRDDPVSDAIWVDAVRQALTKQAPINHTAEPARAPEPVKAQSAMQTPPAVSPKPQDVKPQEIPAPAMARVAPVAVPDAPALAPPMSLSPPIQVSAPALPPATPVASAPAPQADDGHPVPPGAIPDANPADEAKAESRSRIGALIAKIPFVGSALDR